MTDTGDGRKWFAFLESNTTGTGRQFCAAAEARGMRPVLLARDPARYPYAAEDRIETVVLDTGDFDAVQEACERLAAGAGLAGVASSSEYFVAPAARVAAKLGLPAADGEAIARCRRKDAQRDLLAAAGVPSPAYRSVGEVAEAVGAAREIGCPVVLKPVSGSGSAASSSAATRTRPGGGRGNCSPARATNGARPYPAGCWSRRPSTARSSPWRPSIPTW